MSSSNDRPNEMKNMGNHLPSDARGTLTPSGRPTRMESNAPRETELLRLVTAGSVDDGKSTLIGRLLYDAKSIFEDQLQAVEETSRRRGDEQTNLALLTDGLRAEREQGITIDVAYRYFATPRRKFVLADAPGHVEYTRNMITGASLANLAIVLVDARYGLVEQSRRHSFVASLLRIPHLVVAVNKMDLVDWSEDAFRKIEAEFREFAARLEIHDVVFIPISALLGDNVVDRSKHMDWYHGPPLLYHLENVHIASDRNLVDCRFPVQWVIRPQSKDHPDYRGYAGSVAGGVFREGDRVVVLPSGVETTITRLEASGNGVVEAFPPMSIVMHLADDVDISRGDMIARPGNQPVSTQDLDIMVSWMGAKPLEPRQRILVKHTTRWTKAIVQDIHYRLDVSTLHRDTAVTSLAKNDVGRVRLRTMTPVLVDPYRRNRTTGSVIIADEATFTTVGAGMVLDETST